VEVLVLTDNMRTGQKEFRELLQQVARLEPSMHNSHSVASLPDSLFVDSLAILIAETFPAAYLADPLRHWQDLGSRCILAPTRASAHNISSKVNARIEANGANVKVFKAQKSDDGDGRGPKRRRLEAGEEEEEDDSSQHPDTELSVAEGSIVIVVRTIRRIDGFPGPLYNGVRLQVLNWTSDYISCRILNYEAHVGKTVRVRRERFLIASWPRRRHMSQFPLRLAFALTINKAQGQTLQWAGLYLDRQVFAHGQLYSAMSRVRSLDCLRIFSSLGRGRVRNVVNVRILNINYQFIE
jgi:hypothetical protein